MGRSDKQTEAWGECARSGQRMKLKDMVPDGHLKGLLVHPDWYEPRHPQEYLQPVHDKINLDRPMPQRDKVNTTIMFPLFKVDSAQTIPLLRCEGFVANPTVTVS